jgi:hypothetical protein
MATLLFGADNETVLEGNYFDHRIDHGERLVFYAKDLALVNSLLAKHLD